MRETLDTHSKLLTCGNAARNAERETTCSVLVGAPPRDLDALPTRFCDFTAKSSKVGSFVHFDKRFSIRL